MAAAPARYLNNLPVSSSSFIGREREIADVTRLLLSARLLTLTGPGGCGKTRLALAVAHDLSAFEHGAWFADLSGLDDASLVPQVVATILGVPETHGDSLNETLTEYLRPKQLLLILDNCEHLRAACAALAQHLLEHCPDVLVLATSREPLNVPDETVWLVPSLSLPDRDSFTSSIAESEAVQMFIARASEALPDFHIDDGNAATIAQICRRLDGIPLALELAAARVKLLDVVQIAARLDDSLQLLTRGSYAAAPRHQTLRATLDWSYQLLQPRERTLFIRLAVFAGGFTLEAVEAICADESASLNPNAEALHVADMLDVLANLVDKSLVMIAKRTTGEAVRYRLLEPIRQYALEALRKAEAEAVIRDRYLAYFVEFAEQAEMQLKSKSQLLWLRRLEKDHDNLRAALAWCAQDASRNVVGLRLAKALHLFWQRRGYWSEGRRWLQQTVANYDARRNPQTSSGDLYLARAIVAEGWLAYSQGDYGGTRESLERGLDLAQALDDPVTVALALGLQAQLTSYAGNVADALLLSEAGVASARRSGERWTLAWADHIHGMILYRRDEAAARVALDESERLFREAGDKWLIAAHLNVLGYITANAGQLEAARDLFEEALTIGNELEDKNLQLLESGNLAHLAQLQGDTTRAAELYEQALAQARDLGVKEKIATNLDGLGHIRLIQGDLDTASQLLRESLRLVQEIGYQSVVPIVLAGLGHIAAAQGQATRAARVMGAIDAWLATRAERLDADAKAALEQDSAAVRAAMSPEEFEASFASGRTLTLEQAAAEVGLPGPVSDRGIRSLTSVSSSLRLCALGPTRVFLNEQVLTTWPYARVKELLFYLASYPARTKAQIGLALWPDASPAQLRNSLSTTLYHLRRALGQPDWIIFDDDQYHFNRTRAYWFDVEVFEANLVQATRWQNSAPERAITLLQAALDLYQGDLVEDLLEGEWFLLRREELRRKYLDALLQLGQLHFTQADYARAADIYRRAIDKDEVLEEAHRELMRCYARSGERGQALRHYQTLMDIMRDELGSPPAAESIELYERLKRGEEV